MGIVNVLFESAFIAFASCAFSTILIALLSCLPILESIECRRELNGKRVYYIKDVLSKSIEKPFFIVPFAVATATFFSWHDDKDLPFLAYCISFIIIFAVIICFVSAFQRKRSGGAKPDPRTISRKAVLLAFMLALIVHLLAFSCCVGYDAALSSVTAPWEEARAIVGYTSQGTPIVSIDVYGVEWIDTDYSECFSEIGYDEDTDTLYVRFRESGAAYRYLDFPEDEWRTFEENEDPGVWYNDYIKGQYECQKIEE